MREKVAAICDDITVLRGSVHGVRVAVMARLDRLPDELGSSRNGRRSSDPSTDLVQQDLSYLLETLCGLERQVKQLQTEVRELRGQG
jgi:hypothetical protein